MNKLHNVLNTLVLKATGIVPVLKVEDEEGQTLVEYGLILAFIAILCLAALTFLKGQITGVFSQVGSSL